MWVVLCSALVCSQAHRRNDRATGGASSAASSNDGGASSAAGSTVAPAQLVRFRSDSSQSSWSAESSESEDFFAAGAVCLLGCWRLDRAPGPDRAAGPIRIPPMPQRAPPFPQEQRRTVRPPPPPPPPESERVVLPDARVAEIEGAVRAAAEGVHIEMAAQARFGVDFLLWFCVQAGRYRQVAHIRVMDHRTGVEINISRFAQAEVRHADVAISRPTLTLASQFLGARDSDEMRRRHSLEVLAACY